MVKLHDVLYHDLGEALLVVGVGEEGEVDLRCRLEQGLQHPFERVVRPLRHIGEWQAKCAAAMDNTFAR